MTKAKEFRTIFEKSLSDIKSKTNAKRCLILSGGVDTTAILAAASNIDLTFHTAITVITDENAPDKAYAQAAAKQYNVNHIIIHLTTKELTETYLPICIHLLHTYDGMTLRNSLVIAAAFQAAKEEGCTDAIVGDGADELFGGYSFMWGNSDNPTEWKAKRDSMCQKWTFVTQKLGDYYGIRCYSPFMEDRVVEWALKETQRCDCIAERSIQLVYNGEYKNHTTGKVILREAYDTIASWRRKDPIEVGSGITIIGHDSYWNEISDQEFENETKELRKRGFDIKTKENLINFRILERVFGKNGVDLDRKRMGLGEGCVGCCFDVGDEMFCHVCGAYPAPRHMQS